MSVHATVRALKENDEDFEWYPTTEEIIRKVTLDILREVEEGYARSFSVLDIGAGDGRVLKSIQEKLKHQSACDHLQVECFAIEKAIYHLFDAMRDRWIKER